MNDYWVRWKKQADAIANIFVTHAAKKFALDGSYSDTSDVKEINEQKKLLIEELHHDLEIQRKKYRSE